MSSISTLQTHASLIQEAGRMSGELLADIEAAVRADVAVVEDLTQL